ncbi:AAA family ATPase [Pseudomonas sp. LS.1a]|uniref:AAA family ATPase n=1 Tax=Pseudomonas sp. LS.1a TaxID=2920387 RepID=UPI001F1442B2|nr:AAA family ATPase [Pseudomonas sp. LS.1a]UMY59927.1 ATP-binding protein [Pseudomonas sp. LS.1a]
MINNIRIENFKSIDKVDLKLGRFNVFIGENGAGKSNILEAIALAGAARARKLDSEFLASRGVRVTDPVWLRSAFSGSSQEKPICITVSCEGAKMRYEISLSDDPYPKWSCHAIDDTGYEISLETLLSLVKEIEKMDADDEEKSDALKVLLSSFSGGQPIAGSNKIKTTLAVTPALKSLKDRVDSNSALLSSISDFIIYSPENTKLRKFEEEGQIEPLGINGEGVLKLLSVFDKEVDKTRLEKVKSSLRMLGWFRDFSVVHGSANIPSRIAIKDKWLDSDLNGFDQKSANEGFLFLMFYHCLFVSDRTPAFFAIDNIDASLNPKLCEHLVAQLYKMAVEHNKQVILTTHNPAVLDGLDLGCDDQRLFTISRGGKGQTRVRRIEDPSAEGNQRPLRLSESFIRGTLGGLPKGF